MNDSGETYVSFEHTNAVHARTVLVDWMLGNACSYACSYCPKSLHDGTVRWQNPDDVVDFYDRLHTHYVTHRNRRVWLQFTGGEPTMHPQIIRILEEASARGFSVSLISNASRTHRFWTKIKPHLNAVILTYHSEFVDFDHFKGVGEILVPDVPVHINVTMKPAEFDKTHADALALRQAFPDATVSLKPLRVDFETELYEYSDAQMAIMGTLGTELYAKYVIVVDEDVDRIPDDGTGRRFRQGGSTDRCEGPMLAVLRALRDPPPEGLLLGVLQGQV